MKSKMHASAINELYQRARELRNKPTYAEEVLWSYLKTKPFCFKFHRQHPYSVYILDFYCHSLKLVIEVDGSVHNRKDVKLNDIQRQQLLEQEGMKFLRFTNYEVLNKLQEVIAQIEQHPNSKNG